MGCTKAATAEAQEEVIATKLTASRSTTTATKYVALLKRNRLPVVYLFILEEEE